MTRLDFQLLARQRLRESRTLLRRGFASGAYYLAGYAVECGLKACIAWQGWRKLECARWREQGVPRELVDREGLERGTPLRARVDGASVHHVSSHYESAERCDAVVTRALVDPDHDLGLRVIEAAEDSGIPVCAAFWGLFSGEEWLLVLAKHDLKMPLDQITAAGPTEALIKGDRQDVDVDPRFVYPRRRVTARRRAAGRASRAGRRRAC